MKRWVQLILLLLAAATAFGSSGLVSPFAPEEAYNAYGGAIERLEQRLPVFYGGSGQSAAVTPPEPCLPTASEAQIQSPAPKQPVALLPEAAESLAAKTEMALIRVGDRLTTVNDVLRNPSLLAGKGPAEIQAVLGKTPGWKVEALGQGTHAGQGWVLREYTAAGDTTGRLIRWHPGGGRHGPDPYWRVSNGPGGKSEIIPGGPEP